MRFTPKQLRFIDEYLVDLNGKQAAIRAGYAPGSAEVSASKLLRLAKVQQAIGALRAKLAAATGITAERVLNELAKLAFADIRKILRWRSGVLTEIENGDGEMEATFAADVELVASDDLDEATAAAVKEVSLSATRALKVKLYDKRQALNDLGRHLGLFDRKPAPPAKPVAPRPERPQGVTDDWTADLDHASATRQ
jgi:phage terminase small subunit